VKDSGRCDVSLQVAMEMPFDIRSLTSPTHQIKVKVYKIQVKFALWKFHFYHPLIVEGIQYLVEVEYQ
jgi:hypothetical protein